MEKNKGILFYIKSYKFNSVFIKNFIMVLLLFMVPFGATGYLYYSNTKSMLNNEITLENTSISKNVRDVTDTMIKQADYVASYILNTNSVQMFMVNDWFNDAGLKNFITMVSLLYDSIDSVYIYSEINDSVNTSGGVAKLSEHQDNNWYPAYEKLVDSKMIIAPRTKNNIFPQYISVIRPVFDSGEKLGCVIVNIEVKKLLELFSTDKYGETRNVIIASGSGEITASTNRDYFSKNITDIDFLADFQFDKQPNTMKKSTNSTEYIISDEYSRIYDLVYINAAPMNIYTGRMNYILWLLGILSLVIIVVSILVAFIVAVNSFKPMREIISVLEEPEKFNNFSDGVRTGNLNELKYIIGSMLKTIQQNTEMETELAGKLVLMDKSHFAMLQAQINPHFLYNTLETINWMAVDLSENPDNPVSNALANLGEFFRLNTQSSNYFISLKDEIRQTQIYTDILKLRYDDMFEVGWDIDPEILTGEVIKITLQPFIENSVYHGIKPKGSGKIKIKGQREENKIILSVTDDGIGMSAEKVRKFLKTLNMDYKENDLHIGIYNVYRRYKIVFDKDCHIDVISKENEGTTVKLSFPAVEISSEHN